MDATESDWEKIKTLFEAALEQPGAERTAFLAKSCADEAVRLQVEKLLLDHEAAGSFLEDSMLDQQAALSIELLSQADLDQPNFGLDAELASLQRLQMDSLIGQRVGAYQIDRLIGYGGMASVYVASRADAAFQKQVAVKIVRSGSESDEILNRFRNERQTLAGLDHPNIVRLLDGGSTENGLPYFVMDYVAGTPIDKFCDAHTLSVEHRLRLFCKVCDAVEYAHRHLVIHRDLKPANILVTADGMPMLLDFGIAKVLNPSSTSLNMLVTQTSSRRMTPAYASPEQVRGESITPATDVYSLGVVLYELLTGHRPYKLKQHTPAEVERAICEDEPETPSTAIHRVESMTSADGTTVTKTPELVSQTREGEPDKLRRRLRGDLDTIVLMALHKEPQRRYASVETFSQDIQRHLEHVPVTARRSTLGYRTSKFITRHKSEVIVGALMGTVMLGGISYSAWKTHRAEEIVRAELLSQRSKSRRSVAVLGFKNISGRPETAWLSTAFSEMLTTELTAGGKLRTISGEDVAQTKMSLSLPEGDSLAPASLHRVYKNLGSDFVILGSYLDLGGSERHVRLDLRLQDAALGETVAAIAEDGSEDSLADLVTRAGAELRDKLGVPRISSSESVGVQASLPNNPEAARFYAEGVAKLRNFDTLGAKDLLERAVVADPSHAPAHSALAEAWGTLGYDAKAKEEAKKAFDLAESLPREQNLWIEGRFRQINRENEKAIEIYRTLFSFFPDNLRYGLRLATVQKGKDALTTLELLRKLPPPAGDDPSIDVTEADMWGSQGELRKQADAAARAARKGEARGARLLVGRARTTEAKALDQLGERDKAETELIAARKILAEVGDRYGEARALRFMGSLFVNQGRFEDAKRVEGESLQIVRNIGNRTVEAQLLNNLSNVFSHQNDDAGAITALRQSLAISRELGNRIPIAVTLGNLGALESDQGQLQAAKEHFEEALAIDRQSGDQIGVAVILDGLAGVLQKEGNTLSAKSMLEESIETNRHTGRKTELGRALVDLAALQVERGELASAKKLYLEAVQIFTESKSQIFLGDAIDGLGDLALLEGDLAGARKRLDEALGQRQGIGTRLYVAESWFSQANLSLEEGHSSEASQLAEQASAVFHEEKNTDLELQADALRARCLLAAGKLPEANSVITEAHGRGVQFDELGTRIDLATTYARVLAASGKTAEAEKVLSKAGEEVRKAGLLRLQFEIRLVLGETEIKSGKRVAGQAQLGTLEREAKAKGFVLIARKAGTAKKQK